MESQVDFEVSPVEQVPSITTNVNNSANNLGTSENNSQTGKTVLEILKDTKVIGKDGKPLRVFHGTSRDFKEFSMEAEKNLDVGSVHEAQYFTDDPEYAGRYATLQGTEASGANIRPVWLNIKNPWIVPDGNYAHFYRWGSTGDQQLENIRKAGYDGVITASLGNPTEYIIFNKDQVISAINPSLNVEYVPHQNSK